MHKALLGPSPELPVGDQADIHSLGRGMIQGQVPYPLVHWVRWVKLVGSHARICLGLLPDSCLCMRESIEHLSMQVCRRGVRRLGVCAYGKTESLDSDGM